MGLQIAKKWSAENILCLAMSSVVIAAAIVAVVIATGTSSSDVNSRDL